MEASEAVPALETPERDAGPERLRSRRRLLGGGIAALSGLFAFLGGSREARAANGDTVKVGQINAGSQTTTVRGSNVNALMGQAQGGANTAGVFGQSDSSSGRGVLGIATAGSGTTFGVLGESRSSIGRAVRGFASATSGANVGVSGQSSSGSGVGVQGVAPPPNGIGVLGSGPFGVRGNSAATGGRGVMGYASATTGAAWGVLGISESTAGIGVRGEARSTASNGWNTIGVYGKSLSADGVGVDGLCDGEDGIGVQGSSLGNNGFGIRGTAVHIAAEFSTNYVSFPDSISLNVVGRAVFSNAGFTQIAAGFGGVVVQPEIPLRNASKILAMLQSDPGAAVAISHVRWENPSQFTIVLTGPVGAPTDVVWFVIG